MRLAVVFLFATLAVTAKPEAKPLDFEELLQLGFMISAVEQDRGGGHFVLFLQRGIESFVCTLAFKKEGEARVSGPWNRYRECSRLSSEAGSVYRSIAEDVEPTK